MLEERTISHLRYKQVILFDLQKKAVANLYIQGIKKGITGL